MRHAAKALCGDGLLRRRVAHRVQRGLGAIGHAELGQHRADVGFHRLLRHVQQARDLPVGPALGDLREHLTLRAVSASRPPAAAGLLRARTSVPAASGARTVCPSCTERIARTSASGSTSLYRKPVAPARIATVTDAESATLVSTSTLAGRFRSRSSASTASPSQAGQFQVEQDHVRHDRGGQFDGFDAVAGLAHHVDVGVQAEQHPQPLPHHRVVVGDQDGDLPRSGCAHRGPPCPARPTGMTTRTVVPRPGAERGSPARHRPRRPVPAATAGPATRGQFRDEAVALVAHLQGDPPGRRAHRHADLGRPEWRSALCSASCAIRYSAASRSAPSAGRRQRRTGPAPRAPCRPAGRTCAATRPGRSR